MAPRIPRKASPGDAKVLRKPLQAHTVAERCCASAYHHTTTVRLGVHVNLSASLRQQCAQCNDGERRSDPEESFYEIVLNR